MNQSTSVICDHCKQINYIKLKMEADDKERFDVLHTCSNCRKSSIYSARLLYINNFGWFLEAS